MPPAAFDLLGAEQDLLAGLDRAGAGHDDDLLAADDDAVGEGDLGSFGAEAAAGELVGAGDAVGVVDALEHLELGDIEVGGGADAGEDGLGGSGGAVDVEAEFDHAFDYVLDGFV